MTLLIESDVCLKALPSVYDELTVKDKVIGNAVPTVFAFVIAKTLYQYLNSSPI